MHTGPRARAWVSSGEEEARRYSRCGRPRSAMHMGMDVYGADGLPFANDAEPP